MPCQLPSHGSGRGMRKGGQGGGRARYLTAGGRQRLAKDSLTKWFSSRRTPGGTEVSEARTVMRVSTSASTKLRERSG